MCRECCPIREVTLTRERRPAHGILGGAHGIPLRRIARAAASSDAKGVSLCPPRRRCGHAFISSSVGLATRGPARTPILWRYKLNDASPAQALLLVSQGRQGLKTKHRDTEGAGGLPMTR